MVSSDGDMPLLVRMLIPLAPGEIAPPTIFEPIDGYRFETDAEFAKRIKDIYRLHGLDVT